MEAEERGRLDDRWDRLSHGGLSPEEESELRALAETSEEARQAWEAFRPLGADFQARVVRSIQSEITAAKPLAKPLPFRRRPSRIAGWSAAAAAVAAVLILFLRTPAAPLPPYSMEKISGVSTMRGDEPAAAVPLLAPGDRFQTILRPETTASRTGQLEAQIFLSRGPDLRRLEVQRDIDPNGSVQVKGTIDRDIQAGSWILWAVVGRRGDLPDPDDLRRLSARAPVWRKDWVAVPREIRIKPRDLPP
jgi:hypothetical protein